MQLALRLLLEGERVAEVAAAVETWGADRPERRASSLLNPGVIPDKPRPTLGT